jgi:hypothetical protein
MLCKGVPGHREYFRRKKRQNAREHHRGVRRPRFVRDRTQPGLGGDGAAGPGCGLTNCIALMSATPCALHSDRLDDPRASVALVHGDGTPPSGPCDLRSPAQAAPDRPALRPTAGRAHWRCRSGCAGRPAAAGCPGDRPWLGGCGPVGHSPAPPCHQACQPSEMPLLRFG